MSALKQALQFLPKYRKKVGTYIAVCVATLLQSKDFDSGCRSKLTSPERDLTFFSGMAI